MLTWTPPPPPPKKKKKKKKKKPPIKCIWYKPVVLVFTGTKQVQNRLRAGSNGGSTLEPLKYLSPDAQKS